MLRTANIDNLDPRRQFDINFIQFLQNLLKKSHQLIVVGDFNETKNRSKLFQTMHNLGLKDMVFSRHNNIPKF